MRSVREALATSNLTDVLNAEPEEQRQPLPPLIHQVDGDERGPACSLFALQSGELQRPSYRTQSERKGFRHRKQREPCGLYLISASITVKVDFDQQPAESDGPSYFGCDAMALKQIEHFCQQASGQRDMMIRVFCAGDDAGFAKCREPHRLSTVEFRVLKCRQAYQRSRNTAGKPFFST